MFTQKLLAACTGCWLAIWPLAGCTSIRSDASNEPTFGFFILGNDQKHQLVASVLKEHNIAATVDSRGIVVKEEDQIAAMRVLLTDQRMKEAELWLFVMVVAGTGVVTEDGMVSALVVIEPGNSDTRERKQVGSIER